jgi:hypothetical protein
VSGLPSKVLRLCGACVPSDSRGRLYA